MDTQRPHPLSKEILTNIDDLRKELEKELTESEDHYQESLKPIIDPELSSLLMQQHVILIARQRAALAKVEILYNQVQSELEGLNKSV